MKCSSRHSPAARSRPLTALRAGLLLLLAGACGGDAGPTGSEPGSIQPGRFALSLASEVPAGAAVAPIGGAASVSAPMNSHGTGPDFDLGNLRATDEFFFLLSNAGGTSITGIDISSSNPAFEVTPTQISELSPDTGSGTITPIVRVTAVHGIASTGLSFADVLPSGPNSTVIAFNGTTTDSAGASVPVSLGAGVSVNAMVVDIEFTDPTGIVDETNGGGAAMLGVPEATGGIVPVVNIYGDLGLENTGSADITLSVSSMNDPLGFTPTSLPPGGSLTFVAADYFEAGSNAVLALIIDGGGTVSDQSRLPILPNGLIILAFAFTAP
jgi:hypothetical protein